MSYQARNQFKIMTPYLQNLALSICLHIKVTKKGMESILGLSSDCLKIYKGRVTKTSVFG